jgi:hypothetical protein
MKAGRLFGLISAFVLLANAQPVLCADSDDIHWAKEVAADFFESTLAREPAQVEALMSAHLKSVQNGAYFVNQILEGWYSSYAFTDQRIAPDRNEIRFKGTLDGELKEKKVQAAFVIRVAKEKESNRWRVDYFRLEPRE